MRRIRPIFTMIPLAAAILIFGCSITNPLDNFQLILDVPLEEIIRNKPVDENPGSLVFSNIQNLTSRNPVDIQENALGKVAQVELATSIYGQVRLVGNFENAGTGPVRVLVYIGPKSVGPSRKIHEILLSGTGDTGMIDVTTTLLSSESLWLTTLGSDNINVEVHSLILYFPAQLAIPKDVSVSELADYEVTNVSNTQVTGKIMNLSGVAVEAYLLFHTSEEMNRETHAIYSTTINSLVELDLSTADPDVSGINAAIQNKQDLFFEVWFIATDLTSNLSLQITSLAFSATVRASTGL